MTLTDFIARLPGGARKSGGGYMARCPAHEDRLASLSINEGDDGRVLLKCQAGCDTETIMLRLGLTMKDLFPNGNSAKASAPQSKIVATYDYKDESGKLLFQTVRLEPKNFRQRRPNGKGGWIWNLEGVRRVLYRLPELLDAEKAFKANLAFDESLDDGSEDHVIITEGEKDVETARALGFVATCNPMGAGKWDDGYSKFLEFADVTIIADADPPGRKHAEQVAQSLRRRAKARETTVLELPGAKDFTEWVEKGGAKGLAEWVEKGAARKDFINLLSGGRPPDAPAAEVPDKKASADKKVDDRPTIVYTNRQLDEITTEAIEVLNRTNAPPVLFTRGLDLARIGTSKEGFPVIEMVDGNKLRARLAAVSDAIGIKGDEAEEYNCFPNKDVVANVLAQGSWPFPGLLNITECPIVRPDGSIFRSAGYDPATRLYYVPQPGFTMPDVPDSPTPEEIIAARKLLAEPFLDFPFADEASRANMMGLAITPPLRSIIEGCVPLAAIDGAAAGTGKGLAAQVACVIATGKEKAVMTAPGDEDEWCKKITATLLSGASLLLIDNVEGELKDPSLAALLTTKWWEDRRFREHAKYTLPNLLTPIATGNNLMLGGDIPRRCYWIRMVAATSRPWERTGFTHPQLIAWVKENRGRLVAAILTLARAWFVAGKPKGKKALGSFEDWSLTIGGVLENAAISGFLGNLEELYKKADASESQWENFLDALAAEHKKAEKDTFTTADLIAELKWNADLKKALPDHVAFDEKAERGYQTKLGMQLSKRDGKRFGKYGIHLEKETGAKGPVTKWKIVLDKPEEWAAAQQAEAGKAAAN